VKSTNHEPLHCAVSVRPACNFVPFMHQLSPSALYSQTPSAYVLPSVWETRFYTRITKSYLFVCLIISLKFIINLPLWYCLTGCGSASLWSYNWAVVSFCMTPSLTATLYVILPGLKLQGAHCRNNQLHLTSTIMMDLPLTLLRWVRYVLCSCIWLVREKGKGMALQSRAESLQVWISSLHRAFRKITSTINQQMHLYNFHL